MNILKTPKLNAISGILLVSSLSFSSMALADEAAISLLNRMNQSLHELSYKGTLAYLRGDSLSTLGINHSVVNGVENETVVRLNESGSKVSRELKGFSLSSIPKISPKMKKVYSFDMGRTNRIANLPCVIITARPKDRQRYLQKFCINKKTGMLLDYVLVGKSHKPVEQFMFTNIQIASPRNTQFEQKSKQAMKTKGNIVPVSASSSTSYNTVKLPDLDDGWEIKSLPKGYGIKRAPNSNKNTKHYIISDGLSSLSVFVSPFSKNEPATNVVINSGALNVLSQRKANYVVTVVGEVPENTLKTILNNIRRK